MTRNNIFIGAALLILVAGLWYWQRSPQAEPTPSSDGAEPALPAPKLAIDLYPLYAAARWDSAGAESVTIGTTTYAGAVMKSAPIDAGMNPGSVITPFTDYYDRLLASHGWHIANDLAAGGHTGGQAGYQNGPGTILVGFTIDYQTKPENAPTECPCTVTFSLFSSGATD